MAAVTGVAIYFAHVGLDKADKLGSVIGALLGLAGLTLALYGAFTSKSPRSPAAEPAAAAPTTQTDAIPPADTVQRTPPRRRPTYR
jgi:hypothetical protein